MALKKIGALWTKESKKGGEFLSGTLDLGVLGEVRIMVFKNEKTEENHPDYTVQLVVPDEEKK